MNVHNFIKNNIWGEIVDSGMGVGLLQGWR